MSLYLESTHDKHLDNKSHFSNSVYVIRQSTISLAGCNENKPLLNVRQGRPGLSMFHEPHLSSSIKTKMTWNTGCIC